MKKKYDVETFLADIEKIFKSNLNTAISKINREKTGFDIEPIPADGWYLNHIPQVWDYKQFIVWGLGGITLSGQQADAAIQTVTIFIEACVVDEGSRMDEALIFKLLRYSRSLFEVSKENFDIQGYGKLKLDSLSPSLVDISGKRLRMAGINITASFEA